MLGSFPPQPFLRGQAHKKKCLYRCQDTQHEEFQEHREGCLGWQHLDSLQRRTKANLHLLRCFCFLPALPNHPRLTAPTLGLQHAPRLAFILRRHLLSLARGLEEQRLASWALALDGDGLHVHDVFCVLLQIPERTRSRGGVHLLDEAEHPHIFLLKGGGLGMSVCQHQPYAAHFRSDKSFSRTSPSSRPWVPLSPRYS